MAIHLRRGAAATVTFSTPQEIIISHVDDSIRLGDGTTLSNLTPAGSLYVNQEPLTPSAFGRITITDTPVQVPTSLPSGAQSYTVRVVGTAAVYFGTANSVSSSNGYPKFQYEEVIADFDTRLWAVCASGQSCEVAFIVATN